MAKLTDLHDTVVVAQGGTLYIRDPRNSNRILQVISKGADHFVCYPVLSKESTRVITDSKNSVNVPFNTEVHSAKTV